MPIRVLNLHFDDCSQAVYIGRPGKGRAGSVLANPRPLGGAKPGGGVWERGETVALFEADLRQVLDRSIAQARWWDQQAQEYRPLSERARAAIRSEMNRLFLLAKRGELSLACFCKNPKHPHLQCHGDGIVRILEDALAATS